MRPLRVRLQVRKFAPVVLVLHPLDQSAASADARTARLMVDLCVRVQWAMYCAVQASSSKAQRGQDAPFRNIEPIAYLILTGECGADFRRQPVEPERNESETDRAWSRGHCRPRC